jgi:hypothetical protein
VSPTGYASHEGKAFAIGQLLRLEKDPHFFLDIGAGAGSWMEAVRPWFLHSKWMALEAWDPYIQRFCLWERYRMVLHGDARTLGFPQADVTILGDVLEHMTKEEAILVWKKARVASRQATILSIPVIHYPQGHVHDNPFQEHVKDDWTHEEVMDTFEDVKASQVGETVGTYVAVT